MKISNNLLIAFAVFVTIFSISVNLTLIHKINTYDTDSYPTGRGIDDIGLLSICMNSVPRVLGDDCSFNLVSNFLGILRQNYSCIINVTDPDNDTINFYSNESYVSFGPQLGNIIISGNISVENESLPDNLTLDLTIQDDSTCDANSVKFSRTYSPITYNTLINLIQNFPDDYTTTLNLEEGFSSFYSPMGNFFEDIDSFDLTFNYHFENIHCFKVDIQFMEPLDTIVFKPGYGSASTSDFCEMYLSARNSYGGYNRTNVFKLIIKESTIPDLSGGGGGGGGGGAPSGASDSQDQEDQTGSDKDCVIKNINCTPWSECRYVDPNNESFFSFFNRLLTEFSSPDEVLEYNIVNDGLMTRECTWMTNCPGQMAPAQQKICDFKPSCNDSVKNCHEMPGASDEERCEEGIDCGGPCNPCPTCFDFIQNQGETGIDCGGPCATCSTCTDGIKNCYRLENGTILCEEGIDCGGPCVACPSCSDSIKNCHRLENGTILCEEGIDCGGPCPVCKLNETPGLIEPGAKFNIFLIFLIISLTVLTYRLISPNLRKKLDDLFINKIKSRILKNRNYYKKEYLNKFESEVTDLMSDFDSLTASQVKYAGDDLIASGESTGYNIDRYSVSLENDYATILEDSTITTINYSMYLRNIRHGKKILSEIMNRGIKPEYSICKRSSSVLWDESWGREDDATYETVNGKLLARTVEYIISFKPKTSEEADTIVGVLEEIGSSKKADRDAWDVPDIRITGKTPILDYKKVILNTKSVAGQKMLVLTKDKPLDGYKTTDIYINPELAEFIK